MMPARKKTAQQPINTFANVSTLKPPIVLLFSLSHYVVAGRKDSSGKPYPIPAPITNERPMEIIIAVNPTARLSLAISSSTRNVGVRNSKIK